MKPIPRDVAWRQTRLFVNLLPRHTSVWISTPNIVRLVECERTSNLICLAASNPRLKLETDFAIRSLEVSGMFWKQKRCLPSRMSTGSLRPAFAKSTSIFGRVALNMTICLDSGSRFNVSFSCSPKPISKSRSASSKTTYSVKKSWKKRLKREMFCANALCPVMKIEKDFTNRDIKCFTHQLTTVSSPFRRTNAEIDLALRQWYRGTCALLETVSWLDRLRVPESSASPCICQFPWWIWMFARPTLESAIKSML